MSPELEATAGQWAYSHCYCNVTVGERDWTFYGYKCAVCGNKNLRFIHVLKHPARRGIEVGIECAQFLVGAADGSLPRLAENESARKEKWRRRYGKFGMCVTTVDDLENRGKL
jgi:hypothetical protein